MDTQANTLTRILRGELQPVNTQANITTQARERIAAQADAQEGIVPYDLPFKLSTTDAALVRNAAGIMAMTDAEREAHKANRATTIESLKAAGIGLPGSQDAIKREYWIGYCARRMNPTVDVLDAGMLAFAAAMLALSVKDRGDGEMKRAYDAARASWSAMLKACAVPSHTAGAQAAETKRAARQPKAGESDKPGPAPIPIATSAPDAHAYLLLQGTTMLAYCDKNAIKVPIALKSAVADFLKAVKAWQPA